MDDVCKKRKERRERVKKRSTGSHNGITEGEKNAIQAVIQLDIASNFGFLCRGSCFWGLCCFWKTFYEPRCLIGPNLRHFWLIFNTGSSGKGFKGSNSTFRGDFCTSKTDFAMTFGLRLEKDVISVLLSSFFWSILDEQTAEGIRNVKKFSCESFQSHFQLKSSPQKHSIAIFSYCSLFRCCIKWFRVNFSPKNF